MGTRGAKYVAYMLRENQRIRELVGLHVHLHRGKQLKCGISFICHVLLFQTVL